MTPIKMHSIRASALFSGDERRRSQRVIIRVPVTLEVSLKGGKIRVPAQTVAVNTHGAMILCPRNVDPNAPMAVLNERTRQQTGARVSRSPRESSEGYLIPVEFTSPSPNFWQISFPPENWKASDN
jgi:hypothetical protein